MKKILVRLLIALLVLLVLAAIAVHFFLDSVVKRAVETVGPQLTKVEVKLDSVNIVLLSGSGSVKGLLVGNPEGYTSPSAIRVGTASLALQPASLLSEKIVVKSINVHAPDVTFETDLTKNNLSKILANLKEAGGEGKEQPPTPSGKPPKKLQVDSFVMTGGKIHVIVSSFGGKSATVALPEIRLKDLGTNPEGITPAALASKALEALVAASTEAAKTAITDLSKGAMYLSGEAATNTMQKVTKGLGDLLPKKK